MGYAPQTPRNPGILHFTGSTACLHDSLVKPKPSGGMMLQREALESYTLSVILVFKETDAVCFVWQLPASLNFSVSQPDQDASCLHEFGLKWVSSFLGKIA